jgi:hypothetical protein
LRFNPIYPPVGGNRRLRNPELNQAQISLTVSA